MALSYIQVANLDMAEVNIKKGLDINPSSSDATYKYKDWRGC